MTIQIRIKTTSGGTSKYEIRDVMEIAHTVTQEIVLHYIGAGDQHQTARILIDRLIEMTITK